MGTSNFMVAAVTVGALALVGCGGGSSSTKPSGTVSGTTAGSTSSGGTTGGSTGGVIGGTSGHTTSGTTTSGTTSSGTTTSGGLSSGTTTSGTTTSGTTTAGHTTSGTTTSGTTSSGTTTSGTTTSGGLSSGGLTSGTTTAGHTTSGTTTSGTTTSGTTTSGTTTSGTTSSGTTTSGTTTSGTTTSGHTTSGTTTSGTTTSGTTTSGTTTSGTTTSGTTTSGTTTSGHTTSGTTTSGTTTSGTTTSGTTTSGSTTGGLPAGFYFAEEFSGSGPWQVGGFGTATKAGNGWGVGNIGAGNDPAGGDGNIAAIGWGATGYPTNASDGLVLPALDLTRTTNPVLMFAHAYSIEQGNGAALIAVYDGTNSTVIEPQGGYPTASTAAGVPGFYDGDQSSWSVQIFDLTPYVGLAHATLFFYFQSAATAPATPGFWAVDGVFVAEASALGLTTGGSTSSGSTSSGTTTSGSTTSGSTTSGTTTSGTTTSGSTTSGSTGATLMFSEDFEGSTVNMGAVSGASTPEWAVGDPSQYTTAGLPSAAAQGSFCAGTVFVAGVDPNAEDLLYTPEIDFTGATQAAMGFKAFYKLSAASGTAHDGVRLLATPDQGTTWYLLTPDQSYPYAAVDAFTDPTTGNSTPGFSGTTRSWKTITVDLTAAVQFAPKWIIAWEFASVNGGTAGFFLDDIQVTAQ